MLLISVVQDLFKKFAKRVSEHLMSKSGTASDSNQTEAKSLLSLYFKKFGKFTCDDDIKKVDELLQAR